MSEPGNCAQAIPVFVIGENSPASGDINYLPLKGDRILLVQSKIQREVSPHERKTVVPNQAAIAGTN